jgi:C_GCAxxG_C_C family probable redox protein
LGFNCAECVAEALLGELASNGSRDAWKLSTGFGGGIGLYGDTCGALVGGVFSVGAVHGRSRLPTGESQQDVLDVSRRQLYTDPGLYRIFNQLPNWFRKRFGHTTCRELTARWHPDWLCKEHALFCREIISNTAGFAASLMLLTEQDVRELRFGHTVEDGLAQESGDTDPIAES